MDGIEITQVMEMREAEDGKVFTGLETATYLDEYPFEMDTVTETVEYEESPKVLIETTTRVEDDIPPEYIARMIQLNEGIR